MLRRFCRACHRFRARPWSPVLTAAGCLRKADCWPCAGSRVGWDWPTAWPRAWRTRVHGGQHLRLFNAFHDDYGFQPIVVFDGEGRFVTALLRPGKRPGGYEIRAFLRRLVGAIRAFWPRVEILLRADSHYACPEVFDWCRENRVAWVLGLAPNAALRRHVEALEKTTAERFTVAPARGNVRRFAQFHDAAGSWSRADRIIARD